MTRPSSGAAAIPALGRTGRAVLLLGALALAAYAVAAPGPIADLIFVSVGIAAAAAVLVALRRRRPLVGRAWFAIGVALALLAGANVLSAVGRVVPAVAVMADVLYLAAYFPLFIAAFRFGRGLNRADGTTLLDTGIIGMASVPLVWEFVVEPRLSIAALGAGAAMALAIPVIAVLLVGLAAPLLYTRASRSASAFLLVGGLAVMGVGDSMFALLASDDAVRILPSLAWLGAYVLIAAAAVVPSARELGAVREPARGRRDLARLALIAIALLVQPLVTIRETLGDSNPELLVFAVMALGGTGLVILRFERTLGQLASVEQRFRSFMSNGRFMAVIKDPGGRYIYMNAQADALQRDPDVEWYGRTDIELYDPATAADRMAADDAIRADGRRRVGIHERNGRIWHTERFALPGRRGEIGLLGVDITDRARAEEAVRFQARLLEGVRDAVIVVGPDRRVAYWNKGAEEILGFTADEMLGETMARFIAPGHEDSFVTAWAGMAEGEHDALECRGQRRDGTPVWLDVKVGRLTDADGTPSGFLGVAKDVTARKEAELELARLGAAIDHATDGVVVTDGEGLVTYVNPAFECLTGLTAADAVGRAPADIPGGQSWARALAEAAASKRSWRGDIVTWRKDGSDLISETSISPIAPDGAPAQGHVTIGHDVTHERTALRLADRRARERALISETIGSLRAGVAPEETARAICDQLVKIPELAVVTILTFGRDGLATVLRQAERDGAGTSSVVLSSGRSGYLRDRAAAGPWVEHWAPPLDHPYAVHFEELGIMAHAYAPIVVDGQSLGLLICGSDAIDAIDRLAERLPALIEFAAITATLLGGAVVERLEVAELSARMHTVINDGAFYPVFQPIVDLATNEVRGYEALTRFSDGTPPDVRFEQAARLGAGLALEGASLAAIFEAAEHLPEGRWLDVNVSPELVLAGAVAQLLPAGTREVVLEITEHQAISDYASFRAAVEPLRDRVKIAIDDAGAGFASLRHIVELSPAMVKLDRSLVAGIDSDPAREAVVAGMVRFAQAAGLSLLAEGIETRQELATLRQLGVQLGQGFLLGRPSSISQATFEALTADAAGSVAARHRHPVEDPAGLNGDTALRLARSGLLAKARFFEPGPTVRDRSALN